MGVIYEFIYYDLQYHHFDYLPYVREGYDWLMEYKVKYDICLAEYYYYLYQYQQPWNTYQDSAILFK